MFTFILFTMEWPYWQNIIKPDIDFLRYSPFYIQESERNTYYQYLTDIQIYGGEPDLFFEFMAGSIARSLQVSLDVIKGISKDEDY